MAWKNCWNSFIIWGASGRLSKSFCAKVAPFLTLKQKWKLNEPLDCFVFGEIWLCQQTLLFPYPTGSESHDFCGCLGPVTTASVWKVWCFWLVPYATMTTYLKFKSGDLLNLLDLFFYFLSQFAVSLDFGFSCRNTLQLFSLPCVNKTESHKRIRFL